MKYFFKNIWFWMDEMIFAVCTCKIKANCYFIIYVYFKAKMRVKPTTLMIQVHCSTRWAMKSWYIGCRSSVSFNIQHRDLKLVARHQLTARLASWNIGDQDGAMKRDDDHCHALLSPGEQKKFTSTLHHFAFTILHMQLLNAGNLHFSALKQSINN